MLLLTGAVALAGALAWRLSRGPIVLPELTRRLERGLSPSDGSVTVRIGTSELTWDGQEHEIDLLVRDVEILAAGDPLLRLPVASLKFAAWPLLAGRFVLRVVELPDPHWTLQRDAAGGLRVVTGAESADSASLGDALGSLLAPSPTGPFAELRRIEVSGGQVSVAASEQHPAWRFVAVACVLRREPGTLALDATARFEASAQVVPLTLTGAYGAAGRTAAITFADAAPPALAKALAWPRADAWLAGFDGAVGGTISTTFDPALRPERVEYMLRDARRGIQVAGQLDAGTSPMAWTATTTSTRALAPAEVARLWPAEIASGVRRWVTARMAGGALRDVQVALGGQLESGEPIKLETVDGRFVFDGVSVRPLDGAPALEGVTGRARFERDRWQFEVARARVGGIDVARGTADLSGLDSPAAMARLRATVRGPVARAVALVETQTGRAPLPAAGMTGRLDATLTLDLPLARAVDVPRAIGAIGRLHDVGVPRLMGDRPLTNGDFTFEISRGVFTLRGGSRLAGAPLDVVLTQGLDGAARRLVVTARPKAAERAALGFELRPWVDGPTAIRVTFPAPQLANGADVSIDLRDAVLAVPRLEIDKRAGVPSTAEARLVLDGARVASIENAALRFGATHGRARASLARDGTIERLDLQATLAPGTRRRVPVAVRLEVTPGSSARTVVVTADEAVLLFDGLGLPAKATGGHVRLDGTLAPGPGVPFDGRLEARDFTLTESPLLARLLALTSVSGLGNALGGRGIAVKRLAMQLRYRTPTLTVTDGTLESPSLGLRLAGTVDTAGGMLDLRGSVVPSYYGLNTLAGRVPVLGTVLTGTKKEGLQVFAFTVSGAAAAPKVSVNPASSLAPGAMRDLLNLLPRPTTR